MENRKKVEILAPAGSFDSMKAAVAAGADAVYMGGARFGARAYADNPDEKGVLEAIDYVHLHGCRLYMTVNTLVKEGELSDLYEYLLPYYRQGLDAAIVQDMGVFSFLREYFPDLPVHASTQMTITGAEGAAQMMQMGASRIVTARELSLEEIRRIYRETGAEIESFVHGALCYCYSGQCLFSSLIGGRSGNRGRCAQTCRLPFEVMRQNAPFYREKESFGRGAGILNRRDEKYVLSLKDLCTLDILPDILEAGVYSLKIEGRMKSPRYTAGVVRLYRKYVDRYLEYGRKGYRVEEADRRELLDLFDRGGQTDGYYLRQNGRDMVVMKEKPSFRPENRELYQYLDQTYVEAEKKEAITGLARVKEGTPLFLTVKYKDRLLGRECAASVEGAAPLPAKNQPMTADRIEKQLKKTGNTPFYIEKIETEMEGRPFVPVQELNELRRRALEALLEEIYRPFRREAAEAEFAEISRKTQEEPNFQKPPRLVVSLERPDCLKTVLSCQEVFAVYLDSGEFGAEQWADAVSDCHSASKECWLILPHIFRERARKYFLEKRLLLEAAGFDGFVIRSWEEISMVREWFPDLPVLMDFGMYTMNRRAEEWIRRMAPELSMDFTLPVELNSRELSERGCAGNEMLVYGSLPVMVSAQCVKKTVESCTKRPEVLCLRDRKGKNFPVRNHCRFCYNTIYNSSPLSLLGERKRVLELGPSALRLAFTGEDSRETARILGGFVDAFLLGRETELSGDFTKGHFRRGVE